MHHHVDFDRGYACEVDLVTGAQRSIEDAPGTPQVPSRPTAGWAWHVGAHSGWIYQAAWSRADDDVDVVFDPRGRRSAPLPITLEGEHCDLIETADAVVTACAQYELIRVEGQPDRYRYWVELARFGLEAFPPIERARWRVQVRRADEVKLSPDGRRLAWWSGSFGAPSVAGLIDATTGAPIGPLPAEAQILDLDFAPDRDELVVVEARPTRRDSVQVRRVALATFAARGRWTFEDDTSRRVYWMADGRILLAGFDRTRILTTVAP